MLKTHQAVHFKYVQVFYMSYLKKVKIVMRDIKTNWENRVHFSILCSLV